MSAGAVPYPIVPPLPPHEVKTTTPGFEETVLTEQDKLRLAEQKALEAQQVDQVKKQNAYNTTVAAAESELDELAASERVKQEKIRAQAEADTQKDIDSWKRNVGGAYDAAQRAPTPTLFAGGQSTVDNVLRAFNLMLLGVSDAGQNAIAVQQGRAPASRQLHDFIETDLAQQKANIDRLGDKVVLARTGLKDANEARDQMMAQVDARAAATYKRLEALGRARLSALKMDKAAIDGNAAILDVKEAGLNWRAKATDGLTRKIQGKTVEETNREPAATTAGGGVEADKNAAEFEVYKQHAQWIANEMPKLTTEDVKNIATVMADESVLKERDTITSILTRLGIDPEKGASTRVKEYLDHVRRGGMAVGRLESGAAIGKVEGNDLRGYMLPHVSDKTADLEMRSKNLSGQIDVFGQHFSRPGRAGAVAPPSQAVAAPRPAAAPVAVPPSAPGSPEDVNSEAPLPEDPKAASIDSMQPGAKPAAAQAPAVGPQEPRRERLIRLLRANPTRMNDMNVKATMRQNGVTEADVRGN